MVFYEESAAVAELFRQIGLEVLTELGTSGAGGVRHLLPDVYAHAFERIGVDALRFHLL